MVLIAACFGIFTLFINTDWPVKAIAMGALINCFFSAIPYESFTGYISVVFCCYLYIFASRIDDWDLIFKALQSVVILDCFVFFMQTIHHDPLLNFGLNFVEHFGTLGQHMQMGSFSIIICAVLLPFNLINILFPLAAAIFCQSSWTFLCVGSGLFVYALHNNKDLAIGLLITFVMLFGVWDCSNHKIASNSLKYDSGRMRVWQRAIQLTNQRPWTGYGIASFKDIFGPLSRLNAFAYMEAHNFIIQLLFETGYIFTGAILLGLGWLCWFLFKAELWIQLSGLVMMLMDGLVHFPDRMIESVPLIIVFFAYTKFTLKRYA